MEVKFLSSSEQAVFNDTIHDGGELSKLFFLFLSELESNCDHDSVMVSFDDDALHASIEDTPYLVIFDEGQQQISLEKWDSMSQDYVWQQDWDFDEDSVEEAADYISSQIYYGDGDDT